MAYKIKVNQRFRIKSRKVYNYLVDNWGVKVADDFIENLYLRIYKLSEAPFAGSYASKRKGIRKIIISKHNKIYYRVKGRRITILDLFESKQDPKKNKYE